MPKTKTKEQSSVDLAFWVVSDVSYCFGDGHWDAHHIEILRDCLNVAIRKKWHYVDILKAICSCTKAETSPLHSEDCKQAMESFRQDFAAILAANHIKLEE